MESKTSVSEDREIKLSTRQNTARGFTANNSYTHHFQKAAHSPHCLGLYHYYAPARDDKYSQPRMHNMYMCVTGSIRKQQSPPLKSWIFLCTVCNGCVICMYECFLRYSGIVVCVIWWQDDLTAYTFPFLWILFVSRSTHKSINWGLLTYLLPHLYHLNWYTHTPIQPMWVRWGSVIVLYRDIETDVFDNLSTHNPVCISVFVCPWERERASERERRPVWCCW